LKKLQSDGYEVTGFFYNPNIHPEQEYTRRRKTIQDYAKQINLNMIFPPDYAPDTFFAYIGDNTDKIARCPRCWRLRFKKTAEVAKAMNIGLFTSTLMVSPYQDIDALKKIGREVADEVGIEFYDCDFRDGYKEGVTISKQENMYRQKHCGCKFSQEEQNKK